MSASLAKIIQFPTPGTGTAGDESASRVARAASRLRDSAPGAVVDDKVVGESPSSGRIEIEDLYPEMVGVRPELNAATRLLARSIVDLNEAVEAARSGNEIVADDAVQRFQGALPELFNC